MFLEPLKRLVLARGHARLRVLISDPARVVREGNRFVQMARRLTSYIELRNVPPEFRDNPAAFIIADDHADRLPPAVLALGRHRRVQRPAVVQALPRLLRRGLGREPDPARTAGHRDRLLSAGTQSADPIMSGMVWKPDVTVAAVAERDGRFLFVEERASGRVVLNQPAGHLEDGETFLEAVVRETLEETGVALRAAGRASASTSGGPSTATRTFLRVAFAGELGGARSVARRSIAASCARAG